MTIKLFYSVSILAIPPRGWSCCPWLFPAPTLPPQQPCEVRRLKTRLPCEFWRREIEPPHKLPGLSLQVIPMPSCLVLPFCLDKKWMAFTTFLSERLGRIWELGHLELNQINKGLEPWWQFQLPNSSPFPKHGPPVWHPCGIGSPVWVGGRLD